MMENYLLSLYQNGTEEEQIALEELCRSYLKLANVVRATSSVIEKYQEALQGDGPVIEMIDHLAFARHMASVSEAKIK